MDKWLSKTLGEILTLNYGKGLHSKKRIHGKIPVYGSNGIVGWHNLALVDKSGIIVGRKGSAGNVHYSEKPFFPIDTTFFVTEEDTDLNLKFLFYLLEHLNLKRILGDVGVPGLNREMAYKETVSFPPKKSEQKKIAYILSTVQQAIEQQERLIQVTTELKKALMHKLFTEGTRGEPQKETEIGLVPESWDVVPLEKTGTVVYGIQASVASNIDPIGTKIITNKNISLEGDLDLQKINYFKLTTDRHRSTILQKGDLLFNWRSGSKEHVGKTAFFNLEGEYTHSSFILGIRPYSNVNGKFLYYYLNWLRETRYFVKLQTYSVNAKFNKSAINSLPTLFPIKKEQDEIAGTIDIISSKIFTHKEKLKLLNELFQTLLHQLMTAQIRVNDIEFENLPFD